MARAAQWQSTTGFLLAAIGFSVGLGNIWRFPYVVGESGGGSFVIVYLLCALTIGLPLVLAELALGRRGRGSPPVALAAVANAGRLSLRWRSLGWLQLLAAALVLAVYLVVTGWVLAYLYQAVLAGFEAQDAAQAAARFGTIQTESRSMAVWTLVALLLTAGVLLAGVVDGIERLARWLVPIFVALLLGLAGFNALEFGLGETFGYLFSFEAPMLSGEQLLAAVGQSFFSLGISLAGLMVFGAHLDSEVSLARSAVIIVLAETAIALLAGLVIFPWVFALDGDPASGPGLVFETLTVGFAQLPQGRVLGVAFFLLLSLASLTTLLGLFEPLVAWIEDTMETERPSAVLLTFMTLWGASSLVIASYGVWAEVRLLGESLRSWLDRLPIEVLLPLGGLLLAVFAGWFWPADAAARELKMGSRWAFPALALAAASRDSTRHAAAAWQQPARRALSDGSGDLLHASVQG